MVNRCTRVVSIRLTKYTSVLLVLCVTLGIGLVSAASTFFVQYQTTALVDAGFMWDGQPCNGEIIIDNISITPGVEYMTETHTIKMGQSGSTYNLDFVCEGDPDIWISRVFYGSNYYSPTNLVVYGGEEKAVVIYYMSSADIEPGEHPFTTTIQWAS